MRDRSSREASHEASYSVDAVVLTPRGGRLHLLLARATSSPARERWALPWEAPREGETMDGVARRLVRRIARAEAPWIEQVGAFDAARRHPGAPALSVAYVAVLPLGTSVDSEDSEWTPVDDVPPLPPRQRAMVDAALALLRARVEQAPIAFRLLPPSFTLSELQSIYEMLLGRSLHKASFRRALHAAALVEATDKWRTEGRGRPAQLFRYAPRRRRGTPRGIRFDFLES